MWASTLHRLIVGHLLNYMVRMCVSELPIFVNKKTLKTIHMYETYTQLFTSYLIFSTCSLLQLQTKNVEVFINSYWVPIDPTELEHKPEPGLSFYCSNQ